MDNYPSINSPNFQQNIAERLEFRYLHNVYGLYPHQEFIRRFMSPYTPYNSLIMYHSLGSGKSIACIAVAVDHYLHSKKQCIVVTKGDSGTESFIRQIKLYRDMCKLRNVNSINDWDISIFSMKHYISLSKRINSMPTDEVKQEFSNKIFILDEVHNIRYIKVVTQRSVYGSVIRMLQSCDNVKVIMATATPMTDNHEQINSLLGICNYSREDKHSMNGIISYSSVICEKPDSIKIGVDNYMLGMPVYESEMTGHQKETYSTKNTNTLPTDIYRELTHISLFCFDDGTHGRDITDSKMVKTKIKDNIISVSTKKTHCVNYTKYSVLPEYAHMLKGKNLRESSSKYSAIIDLINKSEGTIFIFSEEVKGSGLLLFADILEKHGYELYIGADLVNQSKKKRYTICVGSAEICPNADDRLEGFNSDQNKYGDYVQILLGSRVIGESITLKNVRHFHCITPHWNDSTVDQAIGRVIRSGSHLALDEDQRNVKIYIHASIFPDDSKNSVDIKKLLKCKEKEVEIEKKTNDMKFYAVDKYCLDKTSNVRVRYFVNFASIYIQNYIDECVCKLSKIFDRGACKDSMCYQVVSIKNLSKELSVNQIVLKEAICRIIFCNVSVGAHNGKKHFLRAYANHVFTVDDPSMPYVMLPEINIHDVRKLDLSPYKLRGLNRWVEIDEEKDIMAYNNINDINDIRYMSVVEKILFLESCIESNKLDVLRHVWTMYGVADDIAYHFLLYKNLENSYTSTNPVSTSKPALKTRIFDFNGDRMWKNIGSAIEEQHLFNEYKIGINKIINKADRIWPIYGIISVIDGHMRVRLRSIENTEKSKNDQRYVRRGKSLKSIKKSNLIEILHSIKNEPYINEPDNISISEIVSIIDKTLVDMKRYIIL